MTAIMQDEDHAPEAVLRLAEITRPAIADDEILVQVGAASVDRGTWHLIASPAVPHAAGGASGSAGPRPPTRAAAWPGRSHPPAGR